MTTKIHFPKLGGTPIDYLAKRILGATFSQQGMNVEKIEQVGNRFDVYIIPKQDEQGLIQKVIYQVNDPTKILTGDDK